MKRIATYIVLLGLLFPVYSYSTDNKVPSSTVIYQTLNDLWKRGRFNKLDTYIADLRHSRGDYLPVRLAFATYSYKSHVDVDKAISELEEVRKLLTRDLLFASPIFMDVLDSRILRYKKTAQFRSDAGYTRTKLLTTIDPRKMNSSKRSKTWGDEMLYFNAPEVILSEQGVIPAYAEESMMPNTKLKQKDALELLQSVGNHKSSMSVRKTAVNELIKKRTAEGGLKELARGLNEANMVYTYRDTVKELEKSGTNAVPHVITALNDPIASNGDKKCAIWALVRIGVASPEVVQTLQATAENTNRSDVAEYAQRALKYLQNSQKGVQKGARQIGVSP